MTRPGLFNTKTRYGSVAQLLHWATALLILILLPMGLYMHDLPISNSEEIEDKVWLYSLHKTLGMTVLLVAVARIVWAFFSPKPVPLHPERKLETFAAETVHWTLYISILLVPVIGYVHHAASVGFAPIWGPFPDGLPFIPKSVEFSKLTGFMHFILALVMGGSIFLHVAGAMKHAVLEKDGTLTRMVPFKRGDYENLLKQTSTHKSRAAMVAAVGVIAIALGASAYEHMNRINAKPEVRQIANETGSQETREVDAEGPRWIVDHENSVLEIAIQQLGAPVKGTFANWNADIVFDPDDLENSSVTVEIIIDSLTLGSVSEQAKSVDFLNAKNFPQAVFSTDNFEKTENGYLAKGMLDLHGILMPIELPFTLAIEEGKADMSGSTVLNRIDFGVGAKGFADENSVQHNVTVDVKISANRAQ